MRKNHLGGLRKELSRQKKIANVNSPEAGMRKKVSGECARERVVHITTVNKY